MSREARSTEEVNYDSDENETLESSAVKRKREEEEKKTDSKRQKVSSEEEIDYDNPLEEDVEEEEQAKQEPEPEPEEEESSGDETVTEFLVVTNLKRPFTNGELQAYLGCTEVWVNRLRSVAVAKFASRREANKTQKKVSGQKWPTAASNVLEATFVYEDVADTVKATGVFTTENAAKKLEKEKEEENWLLKHFHLTTTTPQLYWCPAPAELREERAKAKEDAATSQ